jgi:YcxB-like protein
LARSIGTVVHCTGWHTARQGQRPHHPPPLSRTATQAVSPGHKSEVDASEDAESLQGRHPPSQPTTCPLAPHEQRIRELSATIVLLCGEEIFFVRPCRALLLHRRLSLWHNSSAMQVTYELTQRDFIDAFKAHRDRSSLRKWALRLILFIVFTVAGVGVIVLVLRPSGPALSNFGPLFVLAAIWAAVIWGAPWLAARKQFSKQPAVQGPRMTIFDSAGVHQRWNTGSSEVDWKNYIRQLEGPNQFLLYSSPVMFNIIPKRAFAPEQLVEFRALLQQKISVIK